MLNIPVNLMRESGSEPSDLRGHYEYVTLETLRGLWRQRFLIAVCISLAFIVALALVMYLPRSYTATALIQFDFLREEVATPSAAVDADSLLASYSHFISSRQVARDVAQRLASVPGLSVQEPGMSTLGEDSQLRSALRYVKGVLLPETVVTDPLERAAVEIQKNLDVTNTTRAYLITISYTAPTAERAALVANAFAQQLFAENRSQDLRRREAAAQQEVLRLSSKFGAGHPSMIAAQEYLAWLRSEIDESTQDNANVLSSPPTGTIFAEARAVETPSSPSGKIYFPVAILLGTIIGIGGAFFMEKRDRGFRNADEVYRLTGIPCIGVIPQAPAERASEAMRILAAETGIIGPRPDQKVILISTPLEDEQTGMFAACLAEIVGESGRELIFLDTQLMQSLDQSSDEIGQLNKIAHYERSLQLRDEIGSDKGSERGMNTQIDSIISAARKRYDVILIQARPALTASDASRLASVADVHLHIVRWRHTRRRPTVLALQQLTQTGVRLSGVVLTKADLARYRKYGAADRFYYFDANKAKTIRRERSRSPANSDETL